MQIVHALQSVFDVRSCLEKMNSQGNRSNIGEPGFSWVVRLCLPFRLNGLRFVRHSLTDGGNEAMVSELT
jgi:hypothetical protein